MGLRGRRRALLIVFLLALPGRSVAQQPPEAAEPTAAKTVAGPEQPQETAPGESLGDQRTELNLLGQTDASQGESRRNENVQFNLVDNNALKELNVRLGVSATVIEDFDPQRRYFGAEFGNSPGGSLPASSLAGPTTHAQVFWRHQNSAFSARSFFQVGDVQPARENRYGFVLSTALGKRLFFSADASQQKLRGQVNGNVLVPRPDEREPLATDPAIRAIVARYLNAFPTELPNRTDINPRALNTNGPQRIDSDAAAPRLDYQVSDRDKVFFRYALTFQTVDAFQLVAGQNPDADIKSHRAGVTWNRTWSPSTVSDVTVAFDRLRTLLVPEENAVGPFVSIGGALTGLGPGGAIPLDRALNHFSYGGRLRQTRGSHTLTTGASLRRRQLNGLESDVHRGFFSFSNNFGRDAITNLRLGETSQHIISVGDVRRGFRNWDAAFYLGDEWRPTSNWQLSLGLRYELVTSPTEVNDRDQVVYGCDCNNVSPRFGFAYRLPGSWGVWRGAYGLHYGEIFPVTYQQVRFAPPGNRKIVIPDASLLDPLGSVDPNDPNVRPTTFILDENLVAPYSHQYNLSWEFEPFAGASLQLGYVGSRSHKLFLMWYTNRAQPREGIPQTTATLNIRREVDGLADIRRILNGSIGYFDAARATLVLPQWRGLTMRAAYWFSKAIDLGSTYTNTAFNSDSRLSRSQTEFEQFRDMRALSDFDQPHALLWTASYRTPGLAARRAWLRRAFGEWELSWVALLKAGTPFAVLSGSDSPGFGNVDGNGGDRPNLVDPSVLGRTVGDPDTASAQLPREAFSFMGLGASSGNLGRNTFRKGGIRNVNAALSRRWALDGDVDLMLRIESVNLLNTPQFAEPGNSLVNPNFGVITNTLNDGRTFEWMLQLGF